MPGEPIAPRPKRRAGKKQKKRRGTARPNLDIINARRREEAAARRGVLLPSADPFAPLGIIDFFDRFITKNEVGESFNLVAYQREILDRAFTFDAEGKLAYTSYIYSEPKKSGKTAVGAGVATWWAYTQEAPNQIFIVANDLDQAQSVTFQTICGLITRNPLLATRAKIFKSEIRLDNGTVIKAIANDFAGAAGSRHGLVVHDEIWGSTSEASQRLFEELTRVPTRRNSIRFISTYAGFVGESELLWRLYLEGVGPEEHPDGKGTRVHPDLPIYVNRDSRMFTYWSHVPRMEWQTPEYYAEQRRTLRPAPFLRLHENRWTSSETRFITEEMYEACLDREHRPVLQNHPTQLYVGVDIGIKHDSSAVVAVMREKNGKPTVALHRIWKPTSEESVRLEDVVEYLLELKRKYRVKVIVADPNQMLGVIQRLKEKGLPIQEYPQTTANLTQAGQVLFDLVRDQNIRLYPNAELREHLVNAVVVESSRGWRLAKDKASKKIDAAVALAMALVALQGQPEGFEPIVLVTQRDTSGNVWIDGKLVTEGRSGMSKGYAGPDAGFVHPHERAVDMRSEWDAKLGPSRAERKRRAWAGEASEPGSARPREAQAAPETTSAMTPETAAPPFGSTPAQPPAGSADLQSTCQACTKEVLGTSLAELEAAEARHLANSETCKKWQIGRAHNETFKRASRRTRRPT
jgi:phage terminase large subunit-like protein